MIDNFLVAIAIGIMVFGFFIILRPGLIAQNLQKFYSRYPLVRYAGERQLRSRNPFVIILGIVIFIVGFIALLSKLGKLG